MARQSYPVASSAIARIEYDDLTQEMTITFARGGSYVVPGVPGIELERLINSGSPGGYWNANMKGRY
jgi:hypothetical protein